MSFKEFWRRGLSAPDGKGGEVCDPKPMAIPEGCVRPITLADEIRMLMGNQEFRSALQRRGEETFEDADDFDCGPEEDMSSPWEDCFDPQHGMTRELELMAGAVVPPNWQQAREIVEKANAVLARYNADGSLKEAPKAPGDVHKGST